MLRLLTALLSLSLAMPSHGQVAAPPAEVPVDQTPPAMQPQAMPPPEAQQPVSLPAPPAEQSGRGKDGVSMKEVFAGTLAAVLQASGSAVAVGLAQAITGGLTNWFSRRAAAAAARESAAGGKQTFDAPPQGPSTLAGSPPAGGAMQSASLPPQVHAGLAFEVHALDASGSSTPVDPAVHEFHTGDRFVVYYRTTMPGRMEVYNINAAGQQVRIDDLSLAAGELARLGPYEFTALTGDEMLRLVLWPCSSPELLLATRDIVKVSAVAAGGSGIALASCTTMATRSARMPATRDIRKVTVEGMTGFALDPVSQSELARGELAPREITLAFRHR